MKQAGATALFPAAAFAVLFLCSQVTAEERHPSSTVIPTRSSYDAAILSDHPVLFLNLGNHGQQSFEGDEAGSRIRGVYLPAGSLPASVKMPNGDVAPTFDGAAQYLEVASSPLFSIATTGILTIEAWIAPKTLQFKHVEGSGYVYWLGKGEPSQYEYAGRMYSATNREKPPRPNRISGYAFNRNGGLGSGSYFQDPVGVEEWIYVTLIFNTRNVSPKYPSGYCSIFKNGILRAVTPLAQFDVEPVAGEAPLRIGTFNGGSYFAGAIGKVAIYDYELSSEQMLLHARLMFGLSR